ncbi:MAG: ferrous iron transport protein A [Ignavibacteriales bacterium]|nr:ferrous iron transport protein A [Ignavibacteriales bacterium]
MREVSLSTLAIGEGGKVSQLNGADSSLRQRLMEMGIIRGTKISIERFAPLGDPIEINVRGYRLSLRKKEAEHILVHCEDK